MKETNTAGDIPRFLYWLIPLIAVASVLVLAGVSPVLVGAVAVSGWFVWALFDNGRALRHPAAIVIALMATFVFTGMILIVYAVIVGVSAA